MEKSIDNIIESINKLKSELELLQEDTESYKKTKDEDELFSISSIVSRIRQLANGMDTDVWWIYHTLEEKGE